MRSVQNIPNFRIDGIEVSRIVLGCDSFISWIYQGGDSPFKSSDGNLNVSKVLEVMKASVSCGVKGLDLSPPLVEAFIRLQDETGGQIVGLGALQEWTCKNFTIKGIPLEEYTEEIKATICSKFPQVPKTPGLGFIRSLFVPSRSAEPLT